MIARRVVAALLIVDACLCFAGCLSPTRAQDSAAPDQVVIGHLKTADKSVTIHVGPNGPFYTVTSKAGEVLAFNLSTRELSEKFPELQDVVEKGIADWAGIDLDGHMPRELAQQGWSQWGR